MKTSPVFRTHCDHCERRFYLFPFFEAMKDAMLLRSALVPYVYTAARQAFDTGVAPVHPLHYHWPQLSEAYEFEHQYMFGADVLAAPVATPVDNRTALASKPVWVPPGTWVLWDGSRLFTGPAVVQLQVTRAEIPLLVRQGAAVPLRDPLAASFAPPTSPLVWVVPVGPTVQPAPSQLSVVYEDDGLSEAYLQQPFSAAASLCVVQQSRNVTLELSAAPADGRLMDVQLRGVLASVAAVTCNGQPVPPSAGRPGYELTGLSSTSWLLAPNHTLTLRPASAPQLCSVVFMINELL